MTRDCSPSTREAEMCSGEWQASKGPSQKRRETTMGSPWGMTLPTAPPSRLSSDPRCKGYRQLLPVSFTWLSSPKFVLTSHALYPPAILPPPAPYALSYLTWPPPAPYVLSYLTWPCVALCCQFWDSPKMFSINWGKFSHYFLLPSSPREFLSSPGLFLISLCVPHCHGSHEKLFLGVTELCAQRFSLWIEQWSSSFCVSWWS